MSGVLFEDDVLVLCLSLEARIAETISVPAYTFETFRCRVEYERHTRNYGSTAFVV